MKPQICIDDYQGRHNADPEASRNRLLQGKGYKDLSTVCLIPTRGMIHAKVVQSFLGLMTPMNQKFIRLFLMGMEVGDAYNNGVQTILDNPVLSEFKYVLTVEDDNMPPCDGLLKLYENMDKFDVVGGLYWTKGEGGQPMIYGDPQIMPKNFIPQVPQLDTIQPCNGLGMGFTLFKMDIFRKVPKPWFKTLQEFVPGQGGRMYSQDLYFFENAAKCGFRFASDTRVKVGHFDGGTDLIW